MIWKQVWHGLLASVAAAGHKDHKWKRRFFVLKVISSSNSDTSSTERAALLSVLSQSV
jgi:hypothetical protein